MMPSAAFLLLLAITIKAQDMNAQSQSIPSAANSGTEIGRSLLRDQVSLNGTWEIGGEIPQYGGTKIDTAAYQRTVDVPASWQGKIIRLEFEMVNYIADVYVNETHVGAHVGGWIPFGFDISALAAPGKPFTLRVLVKGSRHTPISDGNDNALWPIGSAQLDGGGSGIVDNVWLRAYGPVYIDDACIRTSLREKRITMDYSIVNGTDKSRTVEIANEVTAIDSPGPLLRMQGETVTLAPGETRSITLSKPWENPPLWSPDNPRLLLLKSRVMEKSTCLDSESRRFGFREIRIEGNQYRLNGVRFNSYGENLPIPSLHGHGSGGGRSGLRPETWPKTAAMLRNTLNFRVLRVHQAPCPRFILEGADETGLMIIDEGALYCMWGYYNRTDKTKLLDNTINRWVGPWVRSHRNHPCILQWSAMNEMNMGTASITLTRAQCLSVGNAVRAHDPTRPVGYDGDADVGDRVVNNHYPEGYESLDAFISGGDIYNWPTFSNNGDCTDRPLPDKVTGFGEFLGPWVRQIQPDVTWWQGTWVRGMRFLDFNDVRPYTMQWAWRDSGSPVKQNLANGFARVALFDKEYDGLGIAPILKKKYPALIAGSRCTRTLILYNDEMSDSLVTMEVTVKAGDRTVSRGRKTVQLTPGEHAEYLCAFQVPASRDSVMQMVLAACKAGRPRFSETRCYALSGDSRPRAVDTTVVFSDVPAEQLAPVRCSIEIPKPFAPATDWSAGKIRLCVKNLSHECRAVGTTALKIDPAYDLEMTGKDELEYSLKPGAEITREYAIKLRPGSYQVRTPSRNRHALTDHKLLIVPFALPRIAPVSSVDKLAAAMERAPRLMARAHGEVRGSVQLAACGTDLAVIANVNDRNYTVVRDIWGNSFVSLYSPRADGKGMIQLHLVPGCDSLPNRAFRQNYLIDALDSALNVRLTSRRTGEGYEIAALVPLSDLFLGPAAKELRLELRLRGAVDTSGKPQESTVFHSHFSLPNLDGTRHGIVILPGA